MQLLLRGSWSGSLLLVPTSHGPLFGQEFAQAVAARCHVEGSAARYDAGRHFVIQGLSGAGAPNRSAPSHLLGKTGVLAGRAALLLPKIRNDGDGLGTSCERLRSDCSC